MLLRTTLFAALTLSVAAGPPALCAQAPAPATNPQAQEPAQTPTQPTPSAPPVINAGAAAGAAVSPAPVKQTPAVSQPATQTQAPPISQGAGVVPTGGTRVHGTVTDPDGDLIPGATVTMTPAKGAAVTATSGQDGTYNLTLKPGTYTLVVSMKGFSSYSVANLRVPAVPGMTLDAKLTVGETTQVVNVEASAVQVSIDPDSNASATVLTGKDLDALSDDPDELESELSALAGPSAGPSGGQIYVDGFTGGQLPPKSSIREIRVNQNPFSAQFDRLGFGRIEVFTKPGTDKFHGSLQVNGNANFLNSSNPLIASSVYQPPYHTLFLMGNLSGPINHWASFNLGVFHRGIQDDAFTNTSIYATSANATTPCAPHQSGCAIYPVQFATNSPQSRTEVSPRIDLALGERNVLTTRFEYGHNAQTNQGIGTFTLPGAAYSNTQDNFEVQMSDTQTFGTRVINETRGAWERTRGLTLPLSNAPTINVQGAFTTGGYSGQYSADHTDHFEVQNYTSVQAKKNFIRLGARLRSNREAFTTANNTNGTFTYTSLTYSGTGPDYSYATGSPLQFKQTFVNNRDIHYLFNDLGLYAETDWKALPNLTVTYGLRYETQNYLQEHHDWAPRASFAWGVGKGHAPKTVLRGGIGVFYDRFGQSSVSTLLSQNGTNENVYTLSQSAGTLPANCDPIGNDITNCKGQPATQTVYSAPSGSGHMQHLTAPYILQEALGADQQLGHFGTLSVNYLHSMGVHQLAVQNISCNPDPVTDICHATASPNFQYITEGQFHEDQLILNPKVQTTKWLSLFGFYSLITAHGNNSGASTFLSHPGNFNADLGPTTFDVRTRFFASGSLTLPRHIQVSPFVIGQSGNRVNITEGADINGDNVFNDRPFLVAAGTPNSRTLAGCGTFLSHNSPNAPANGTVVPVNYCTGPMLVTVNVRAAKTWGFGERTAPAGQGQGGGGGRRGGGEHGGGGPGFMGFGGGGGGTGQRYNLTLAAQVMNLFNRENVSNPVGTLTSPYFGQSLSLAGGPYTGGNSLTRVMLQASFTF